MNHSKSTSFRPQYPKQARQDDDSMSERVVATPMVEMVGTATHRRSNRKETEGGSPISVLSHPQYNGGTLVSSDHSRTPRRQDAGGNVYGANGRNSVSLGVVMHPIVVVGEDGGAEVTLDHSSSRRRADELGVSEHSAIARRRRSPTFSRNIGALLDTDITPSPMKSKTRSLETVETVELTPPPSRPAPIDIPTDTPPSAAGPETPKSPFGPKLCCGNACYDEGEKTLVTQESIEEKICGLLGNAMASEDFCDGWQAFSYFMLGPDQREGTPQLKEDIRQTLRNRASNMNDRSRRLRRLRDNLQPFDNTHPAKGSIAVQRTQSFCTANHAARKAKFAQKAHSDVTDSVVSVSSAMWAVVSCDSERQEDSPAIIRTRENGYTTEDDLCYDSDPEEITLKRGKLASKLDTKTGGEVTRSIHNAATLRPKRLNFDFHDDLSVKEQVKEMMNLRMTVIWHRGGDSTNERYGSPMAVKAWVEHGHRLRNSLIHPKLMWKPMNQSLEQKGSLGISSENLHSIDLLDVLRVLEVDRIDSRRYVLAKRKNSLLIESMDDKILFETSSQAERDRIVAGLKLVVARLGSKVVLGDDGVFEEFFGFVPVGGLEDEVWYE